MSLEMLNTVATLTTTLVVAAAAIAALVQLRHLRAGNQINAMLTIGNEFAEEAQRKAVELIRRDLARSLEDLAFRDYHVAVALAAAPANADPAHQELWSSARLVGNTYETLGALVKNRIVDQRIFMDLYGANVSRDWSAMEGYIALLRDATHKESYYENFEYLTVLSQDFAERAPSTYPSGLRRLKPRNPWAATMAQ